MKLLKKILEKATRRGLKKKNIIFHIGRPKTGSKAIQFFLYEHTELLEKYGYLYPKSVLHEKFHHPLVWPLKGINTEQYPESPEAYYGRMLEEFEASGCNTCILSSEDASIASDEQYCERIKGLLDGYAVQIVVYLRRQDQAVESSYNQSVKNSAVPFSGSIYEYCNYNLDMDYAAFLSPWEKVFGRENIVVRIFDSEDISTDVVENFTHYLNLDASEVGYQRKVVNPSLDRDALEIVRLINGLDLEHGERWQLMRDVRQAVSQVKHGQDVVSYPLFSFQERKEFLQQFQESNTQVAQKYLGREQLFAEITEKEDYNRPYPGLSAELMVKVFVKVWQKQRKG